jgi:hypothetical protein
MPGAGSQLRTLKFAYVDSFAKIVNLEVCIGIMSPLLELATNESSVFWVGSPLISQLTRSPVYVPRPSSEKAVLTKEHVTDV